MKKQSPQPISVRIEGNNGGDYLEITPLGGNLIQLEVGHCCVVSLRHAVPVEFVTAMLSQAVYDHGCVEDAIRSITWPTDFAEGLCAQVKRVTP